MIEQVILVDEQDNEVGTMEKMEAHRKGILHRAFSVLLFNTKGEILLQKRSSAKYHSAGLWSNTCCSHPKPKEPIGVAVKRRLREEMGIDLQPNFLYKFIYKINLDNHLIEHELDHVFIGVFEGEPLMNTDEVDDWRFANVTWLRNDIHINPANYTYWLRLIINQKAFLAYP